MYNQGIVPDVPKFFGRRKGRVVRKAKQFLLEKMLPQMRVTSVADFDAEKLFGGAKKEICLEIGFGDGQHLYGQAKNNPQNGYVGVEVFQNGVANLLTLISGIKDGDKLPEEIRAEDYPVRNIRVYDDDVRLLFKQIPDNFFDKVFLLFPDPWPKKKHAGRRFVNPDNLKEVYRVLKTGGLFRIATDHPVYKRHVCGRCIRMLVLSGRQSAGKTGNANRRIGSGRSISKRLFGKAGGRCFLTIGKFKPCESINAVQNIILKNIAISC